MILGKGSIPLYTYLWEISVGKRCILSKTLCKFCVT
jgi:hypothetical protein